MNGTSGAQTETPTRFASTPATYALAWWAATSGPVRTHYEGVYEINESEFDAYIAAIAAYRALTERTTYVMLQRNKHALEATIAACSNVERMGGGFRLLDQQTLGVTLTN